MKKLNSIQLPVSIGPSPTLNGIRGVLAARDIRVGECIEQCPVIVVPVAENQYIEQTIFDHYVYEWEENSDCLVLGYCGLSNHSYESNARYERDFTNNTMNYYAIADIPVGSEILINYNGEPDNKEPLDTNYTDFKR